MARPTSRSESSANQQRLACGLSGSELGVVRKRLPWILTSTAIISTLVLVGIVAMASHTTATLVNTHYPKEQRFRECVAEITYRDEVLTMSALMYASTGDQHWRARYDASLEPLDLAIKAVREMSPQLFDEALGQETDAANQALIGIEARAMELAGLGKTPEALDQLRGAEYSKYKAIYSAGNRRASVALGKSISENTERLQTLLAGLRFVSVVMGLVVVAIWVVVIRALNRERAFAADQAMSAQAASQAKSAFLANMSHEIRTPLTAILGFAELLKAEEHAALDPKHKREVIETIQGAGAHLLTVINDILDLSKIEAGKLTVERTETPLIEVLHEIESLLRQRAGGKGVAVKTEFMTPMPRTVLSDPTRLRQILMNLTGNAAKFTESGTITTRARIDNRRGTPWLVIDVEDTGMGMTQEQATRLFTNFGQADSTVTRKYGGTGLGLAICMRLATLMGGSVYLSRTTPGIGSCFTVELPIGEVAGSEQIERFDAIRVTKKCLATQDIKLNGRILLAEDGLDNQRLISFHLRKAGATVEVAENGRIALEMIEKSIASGKPYAMLLSDMQMPEMDGYTLAKTLRQRGSTLAIVALTAHAMAEDRAKCIRAGCDDYATKPLEKLKLLETCAAWMGKDGGAGERLAA